MKPVPRILLITAVAVVFSLAGRSAAYAAYAQTDSPPGDPPYGIAMQGDAGGTKLTGILFIEYSEITATTADARIFARLRRNNEVKAFYAERFEVPLVPVSVLQSAVTSALAPEVLAQFFPGQPGLSVVLKSMSDFVQLDVLPGEMVSSVNHNIYVNSVYRPWVAAGLGIDVESIPLLDWTVPRACTLVIANIEVAVK